MQRSGRQSGLAFVHFDSTPEGLQSALRAIASLDNAVVDETTFKVEPSRNMTKQFQCAVPKPQKASKSSAQHTSLQLDSNASAKQAPAQIHKPSVQPFPTVQFSAQAPSGPLQPIAPAQQLGGYPLPAHPSSRSQHYQHGQLHSYSHPYHSPFQQQQQQHQQQLQHHHYQQQLQNAAAMSSAQSDVLRRSPQIYPPSVAPPNNLSPYAQSHFHYRQQQHQPQLRHSGAPSSPYFSSSPVHPSTMAAMRPMSLPGASSVQDASLRSASWGGLEGELGISSRVDSMDGGISYGPPPINGSEAYSAYSYSPATTTSSPSPYNTSSSVSTPAAYLVSTPPALTVPPPGATLSHSAHTPMQSSHPPLPPMHYAPHPQPHMQYSARPDSLSLGLAEPGSKTIGRSARHMTIPRVDTAVQVPLSFSSSPSTASRLSSLSSTHSIDQAGLPFHGFMARTSPPPLMPEDILGSMSSGHTSHSMSKDGSMDPFGESHYCISLQHTKSFLGNVAQSSLQPGIRLAGIGSDRGDSSGLTPFAFSIDDCESLVDSFQPWK